MYIETSYPRKEGEIAYLMSPSYPQTSGKCFNFWYHMYGDHIGSLEVYVKTSPVAIGQRIFNESGNQGKFWMHGRASVKSPSGHYNVRHFDLEF